MAKAACTPITPAFAVSRQKNSLHPDFYTAAFGKFPHSPYNTAFLPTAPCRLHEPYNTHIKNTPLWHNTASASASSPVSAH